MENFSIQEQDWLRPTLGIVSGLFLLAILLLFLMIFAFALPVISEAGKGSPFAWIWQPYSGLFGILPMLIGSLALAGLTLLLSWPLALGISCWILTRSPRQGRVTLAVRGVIRFMTAIPTVVYGFAAVFLLTPLIRSSLGGSGMGWLTASLMLCLLTLPTMILVLEAGLAPIMEQLCPRSLALGLTRMDILLHVVLPHSRKTLVSAAVLGFGRAAGDTLIPLMLAGNAPQTPNSLIASVRSLTAHMALVTSNEVGGAAYNSLFVAGALLIAIGAGVSLFIRWLGKSSCGTAAEQKFLEQKRTVATTPTPPYSDAAISPALPFSSGTSSPSASSSAFSGDSCASAPSSFSSCASAGDNATNSPAKSILLSSASFGGSRWDLSPQLRRYFRAVWVIFCWASLAAMLLAVLTLLLFLLRRGLPALNLELFFGNIPVWDAVSGKRQVWDALWPACVGTLSLIVLTLALAVVPGVGCGLYLAEYASPRVRRFLLFCTDLMAGMPSIVMGLFGFSLILLLRQTFFPAANTGLLLAAFCLSLLVLPVLVVTSREAVEAVPAELHLTCRALGMSKAQILTHVVLPSASRGILGGIVLALGRAAEDTAVIMLAGVVANAGLPASLNAKFEALSFHIYYVAAQYQSQEELTQGFGAAVSLLLLSAILLLTARRLAGQYLRRWQGGKNAEWR